MRFFNSASFPISAGLVSAYVERRMAFRGGLQALGITKVEEGVTRICGFCRTPWRISSSVTLLPAWCWIQPYLCRASVG